MSKARRPFLTALFVLAAFLPGSGSLPVHVAVAGLPYDPTPPSVRITAPGAGQGVVGTISVQAAASDNLWVAWVMFSVDGSVVETDYLAPYSFEWNTALVQPGMHALRAEAADLGGNTATSPVVEVNVGRVDTVAPSAPANLTATAVLPNRVDLSWTAASDNVGVTGYIVFRNGGQVGTAASTSFSDTTVSGGTTYTYVVKARDAAGNVSGSSNAATVTTPGSATSISFAAAGDHAANANTEASLSALNSSGVNFYLALGDLDYGQAASPQAWCEYVTSRLPALGGTNFPFELVSGNHENTTIGQYAACLPDRMNSTAGPNSHYDAEYYFDYPATTPLVRVVMIAPDLTIAGQTYSYTATSTHYSWLAGVIDEARAAGVPWVVVGMHKVCITTGDKSCEIGADLMNLLVQKKVDLVLQGHDHNYQRSKQLALNSSTCPSLPVNSFDGDCVADAGADGVYTKGAGALVVIDGVFGRGFYSVSPTDPEAGYFARIDATTHGFTKYTVSADRIDAQFVNSNGTFTDSFSITR